MEKSQNKTCLKTAKKYQIFWYKMNQDLYSNLLIHHYILRHLLNHINLLFFLIICLDHYHFLYLIYLTFFLLSLPYIFFLHFYCWYQRFHCLWSCLQGGEEQQDFFSSIFEYYTLFFFLVMIISFLIAYNLLLD